MLSGNKQNNGTAAWTSFHNSLSYVTYLFSEWRKMTCLAIALAKIEQKPDFYWISIDVTVNWKEMHIVFLGHF